MEVNSKPVESPSKLKRTLIIIAAIFLLALFTSYLLIDSSTRLTILSLLAGSRLDNSTLHIDKITRLIFNNESLNTLNDLYSKNLEREFIVCLAGIIVNNTYYIEQTIQPNTFLQEYDKVVSEPCPEDSLVSLHTHPFKQCIPSQQDLKTFDKFKKNNPDALMAIMCDKNLFLVYK